MKRLLIILLCLPLLFACQKDEPFEEGQEIVLNFSVDMGEMQSATRAFADDADRKNSDLWLVVFDSEGYLVEYTQADITGTTDGVTSFKATLHATLEGRIMHLLLNYDDDNDAETDLEFSYGHENNIIGGLTVERDRDVYWQRVELPEGIVGNETVEKYLTKVPLVRNFSKITVTVAKNENTKGFVLGGFYVLNVPKYGTVAPFINGSFVKYYNENAQFNGGNFTSKDYAALNGSGYHGTMPDNDVRIQTATDAAALTSLSETTPYYLYESTYVNGNKDKTVSVLLYGTYNNENYWYRVDLVKPNATTGVIEYLDLLRNFAYNINITAVTAGKTSAQDAITQPAGNNILSSLEIAHLTNVSDGTATLEVNYTDTVLITNDNVTIRYKFTDNGHFTDELKQTHGITVDRYTNGDIKSKTNGKCGYYVTYEGNIDPDNSPISVAIAEGGANEDWRDVTIEVIGEIKARKEVSVTFFALSTTGTVLSRTVHYTLMPRQTMLVECPALVPATVGSDVNVNILIPDGLPEAMFPLDFAIESQAAGNTSYLAQYITPANRETVSVKTDGSIVDIEKLKGKKSFQYVVSLTYEQYSQLEPGKRTVNGYDMDMRILSTAFKTNTAQSASTVYAYNRYFTLGKDVFANGNSGDFVVFFSDDNTAQYGIGRSVKVDIVASATGTYKVESTTLQSPTRAEIATLPLAAGEVKTIELVTSTFADRGQITVTCGNETRTATAAERNTLNIKATSVKQGGSELNGNIEISVYDSESNANGMINSKGTTNVTTLKGNKGYNVVMPNLLKSATLFFSYISDDYHLYVSSATVSALSSGTAELNFVDKGLIVTNITNLSLSGDKYYGEKRDVTFKFTTDRVGTYTITQTEGAETATYTHKATAVGEQTITLKTLTWSDKLNVVVSGMNASKSVEGVTRNTIKFGKLTLTRPSSSMGGGGWPGGGSSGTTNISSGDITITYSAGSVSNKTKTVSASDLSSGGCELECAGITSENSGSFVFSYTYNRTTYESSTLKVSDIIIDTTINLTNN
ncbi:MAG: hypothetical protein IKY67_14740 [Paludibacteraceae bacterium]|nr:hypothetical protein [Paludibacteraceae bacterium]